MQDRQGFVEPEAEGARGLGGRAFVFCRHRLLELGLAQIGCPQMEPEGGIAERGGVQGDADLGVSRVLGVRVGLLECDGDS